MRIGEKKLLQLVESDPPKVVLIDEEHGTEIELTPEELTYFRIGILQFLGVMYPQCICISGS